MVVKLLRTLFSKAQNKCPKSRANKNVFAFSWKGGGSDDFAINTKTKIWADVNVNNVVDFIDKFSLLL